MLRLRPWVLMAGVFALSTSALQAYAQYVPRIATNSQLADTSIRLDGMGSELANIMPDEYTDSRYFAVDILYVDGTKLYTGLSNIGQDKESIVSKNEYPKGAYPESDYGIIINPLGIVTGFANYKGELLFAPGHAGRSSSYEDTYKSVDEGPIPQVSVAKGEVKGETGSDLTTVRTWKETDEYALNSNAANGTLAARIGNIEVAGRVYQDTEASIEKSTYLRNYDTTGTLEGGTSYSNKDDTTSTVTYDGKDSITGFEVGVGLPISTGRFAVNLGVGPASINDTRDSKVESVEEWPGYHWDSTGTSTDSSDALFTDTIPVDHSMSAAGSGFTLRGKYTMPISLFGKAAKLSTYGEYSGSSMSGKYDEFGNRVTTYSSEGEVEKTEESQTNNTETFEASYTTAALSVGSVISLNPTTDLAMGIKYMRSGDKTTTEGSGSVGVRKYSVSYDGDAAKNYSYTETFTNRDKTTDIDNGTTSSWIVPIGFETKLTKNLALRMGATAYLDYTEDWSTDHKIAYGVYEYTKKGDSSVEDYTEKIDRTGSYYESKTSHSQTYSYTEFSTGLSYAINENISLDAVGFGNLTRLDKWTLSANIKF